MDDMNDFTNEVLSKGCFTRHPRIGYLPSEWRAPTRDSLCTHRTFAHWTGRLVGLNGTQVLVVNENARTWWTFHIQNAIIEPIVEAKIAKIAKIAKQPKQTALNEDLLNLALSMY